MKKISSFKSHVRTTQWNLFFHYASIALAIISGVLMVPLYLKFIPTDTYGAWLATGNVLTWITAIDPGLSSILQQRVAVAYGKEDFRGIQELISGGGIITSIIVFLTFISGLIISKYLANWLNLPSTIDIDLIVTAFKLAVIGTSIILFSFSITSINQGLQSSLGIGLIFVSVNIISIFLNIILLYNGFGLLSIPISLIFRGSGLLVGNACYLGWRLYHEKIGLNFNLNNIFSLVSLISYTFLARVGLSLTNNIDSFIASRFIGVEIIPALTFTRQIPEMSKMFVERPVIAFMPSLSHLLGAGEIGKAREVLLRLLRYVSWFLGLLAGGFGAFNQDFIKLWIGKQFFAGQDINLFICIGLVISVVSSCFGNLCFSMGNIKGNGLISFIQSLLYVTLVIFGTIKFGLIGIVAAPVISTLLTSFWYFPMSFFKIFLIPVDFQKKLLWESLKVALLGFALSTVFSVVEIHTWTMLFFNVFSFIIGYVLLLSLISIDFRLEVREIFENLRHKVKHFFKYFEN